MPTAEQAGSTRARWVARLEPAAPAPAAWLAPGCVRPLLWLPLLPLPLVLSAVARTITQCSMALSLLLGAAGALVLVWPFWPALTAPRPAERAHSAVGVALAALVTATAWYCLYNRYFAGLTNYRGTDGGFHVFQSYLYGHSSPRIYEQFVTLYAVMQWLGRVGLDAFQQVVATFYGQVLVTCALPLAIALRCLWPLAARDRLAYVAGLGATLAAALAAQYWTVLPQQHMNQADGFYAHLCGLVPLFAFWACDALVESAAARLAGLAVVLVIYRFTYGLNLGDLAATLALILVADGARLRGWARGLGALAALGLVAAAVYIDRTLWPLRLQAGHIVPYPLDLALEGQAAALALLAVVALASARASLAGLGRTVRVPLFFGVINTVLAALALRTNPLSRYYLLKYPIHSLILTSAAVAMALPALLAGLVAWARARRGWPAVTQAAVVTLLALVLAGAAGRRWYDGLATYRPLFLERAWGQPPFARNLPLADRGAWRRIDETLAREHKQFGGFLTSQFGMAMFMNAAFNIDNFGWSRWFSDPLDERPGRCIFWDEGPADGWGVWEWNYPNRAKREQLRFSANKVCATYVTHWDPRGPRRTLCHRCY